MTALLIRARSFLERGWCREAAAVDMDGCEVDPTDPNAISWCAYGALMAAGIPDDGTDDSAFVRLDKEMCDEGLGADSVGHFNDAQETVEPILAAFDRAIRSAPPIAQEAVDRESVR
jgi:hypothetical protein